MSVRFRSLSEARLASHFEANPSQRGWQPIPHINQLRPEGAGKDYVNGAYHCGPAVVAMLARGSGKLGNLSDAQLIQGLAKGIVTEEGTDAQGLLRMMERADVRLGGEALGAGYSEQALREHLGQGHKLIAQVRSFDPHTRTSSAHYVLIQGMTPKGNYIISDPLANQPSVVTPQQLRQAVLHAPPDGGLLIPVAPPQSGLQAPRPALPGVALPPAAPAWSQEPVASQAPDPAAFTATDDLFEGVDTCFRKYTCADNALMRSNERRNHFELDVSYAQGDGFEAPRQPVTPKGVDVEQFVEELLELKGRGDMRAYKLLNQLEASTFARDQQVLERVASDDLTDPGIGKKTTGEAF